MNITGILLAAGASTRFGSNKLLHRLPPDGQTILEKAAQNLASVSNHLHIICDPHNQIFTPYLNNLGYEYIDNPRTELGMGTSIACGVKATAHADAWLITLGDMPFIRPQTIKRISLALAAGNKIVAPFYQGQRGHPVGFSRDYYAQLCSLNLDSGAGNIIKDNPNDVFSIEVDDPGICQDVDQLSDINSRFRS